MELPEIPGNSPHQALADVCREDHGIDPRNHLQGRRLDAGRPDPSTEAGHRGMGQLPPPSRGEEDIPAAGCNPLERALEVGQTEKLKQEPYVSCAAILALRRHESLGLQDRCCKTRPICRHEDSQALHGETRCKSLSGQRILPCRKGENKKADTQGSDVTTTFRILPPEIRVAKCLEWSAVKVTRSALRRGRGSNPTSLFDRLELNRAKTGVSGFEAKAQIRWEVVRAYVRNPRYSL